MVRINLIPGIRKQIRWEAAQDDVLWGLGVGLAVGVLFYGYLILSTVFKF